MFHPASPTVMASQIGLSWGGLGPLCSCCCLIWGLGVLQVLIWQHLKDLKRHIKILYETTDYDANESLAFNKGNIIICDDYVGLQHQSVNSGQWWNYFQLSLLRAFDSLVQVSVHIYIYLLSQKWKWTTTSTVWVTFKMYHTLTLSVFLWGFIIFFMFWLLSILNWCLN